MCVHGALLAGSAAKKATGEEIKYGEDVVVVDFIRNKKYSSKFVNI